MAFKMSENSLFAILLRSPWWYSLLIGFVFITLGLVLLGGQYLIIGICGALPFFGIAGVAGYKQMQQPSLKRVQEVDKQARKMTSAQITDKISKCYEQERFDRTVFKGNAADVELIRGNRIVLLCSKRFKVGNTGVEPLKQLVAAGASIEASEYLYVALGDISAAAREYASRNNIQLITATKLAAFFDDQFEIG